MKAPSAFVAASCFIAVVVPAVQADPARLQPFARGPGLQLVAGRDRAAIVDHAKRWLAVDGLREDAAVGRWLKTIVPRAFEGAAPVWGRTPVAIRERSFVRAGSAVRATLPGNIEEVVQLGDHREIWRYSTEDGFAMAIVNVATNAVRPAASLPSIGAPVRGIADRSCASPSVWRIAPSPGGVAALIMECNNETPLRVETVAPDGAISVRQLHAIGHDLEPMTFVVAADGTPVIAGVRDGKVAYARAAADGSWAITETAIEANAIGEVALAPDGAIWTITSHAQLVRDDAIVELSTPDGASLMPTTLAVDAKLGVVVGTRHGYDVEEPDWLFAEHAPGGIRAL